MKSWHLGLPVGTRPARESPNSKGGGTPAVRRICRGWATVEISLPLALSTQGKQPEGLCKSPGQTPRTSISHNPHNFQICVFQLIPSNYARLINLVDVLQLGAGKSRSFPLLSVSSNKTTFPITPVSTQVTFREAQKMHHACLLKTIKKPQTHSFTQLSHFDVLFIKNVECMHA